MVVVVGGCSCCVTFLLTSKKKFNLNQISGLAVIAEIMPSLHIQNPSQLHPPKNIPKHDRRFESKIHTGCSSGYVSWHIFI